ncbi:MAG TPA: ATP synthase F1 subunit delta [Candidatus Eisenbacteria bacterium]|nr:ATP synthase F1 subunit delta [Candidatus Eisenbacteria bacterium]
MRQTSVALKYARALLEASLEEGTLDRLAADMSDLGKLEAADPSYHRFLVSPTVLTEHKFEFLRTVFGPRVAPLTLHLLELLVKKGRINLLPDIVQAFELLVEEHRGLLRARVMSAVTLSPEAKDRLKAGLDRLTGKNVVLETRVDPYVLGGLVVHLGTRILDGSLRNGLRALNERLHRAEVN